MCVSLEWNRALMFIMRLLCCEQQNRTTTATKFILLSFDLGCCYVKAKLAFVLPDAHRTIKTDEQTKKQLKKFV